MAESSYRLIGSIQQGENSTTLGYAVLDLRSNQAVFRSINELIALAGNGLTFQNAVLDQSSGIFSGTDGSLKRLPVFSTDGKVLSNPTVTVLAEFREGDTPTGYYKVMDTYGRTTVCTKGMLIGYLQKLDGTNVKLVNRDGVFVISAILGSFNVEQAPDSGVYKEPSSSAQSSKFMQSASGTEMTEEISKNKKTLANVNIRTKQFRAGIVRRLIAYSDGDCFNVASFQRFIRQVEGMVDSVYAIKGDIATKYNMLIDLNSYLSVSNSGCLFWDKLYDQKDKAVRKWYSDWEARLVREKKSFNKTLRKYNEMKALNWDTLADRKSQGEWLSSIEFSFYLSYNNGRNLLNATHSKLLKQKEGIEISELAMLAGFKSTSGLALTKSSSMLSRKQLTREDVLAYEVPFLREYLLLGKLEYTLDTLSFDKELLSKFSTRKELLRNLDLLFVIAVKQDLSRGKLAGLWGERTADINALLADYLKAGKYSLAGSIKLLEGYLA